jgi:hypothetical protein
MDDLEQAVQTLERVHRDLTSHGPDDFEGLERAVRNRAASLDSVLALMTNVPPSDDQVARLKRVHLGGLLSIARIQAARQALRQELASVSQRARVISGYHAGSMIDT